MGVQIINYGAIIRIDTDGNVLLLSKSQVRDIEIIRDDTVRINLGEGVLREVLIKLSDVTHPAGLPDAAALRDLISHFLDYANKYEIEAIAALRDQLSELGAIKQLMEFYHGSWQTLWNYQQTGINTLMSIENILHSTKVIQQEIIANIILQTLETKNLVSKAEAGNELLEGLQDIQQQSLTNQQTEIGLAQNQNSELFTIRVATEQSRDYLINVNDNLGLIELNFQQLTSNSESQNNRLGAIVEDLSQIRTHLSAQENVFNTMTNVLMDIRTSLANNNP